MDTMLRSAFNSAAEITTAVASFAGALAVTGGVALTGLALCFAAAATAIPVLAVPVAGLATVGATAFTGKLSFELAYALMKKVSAKLGVE